MAEYLSTYAAAQKELISHRQETEHDRVCSVEGTAPDRLEFKGPFLSEFPRVMKEARERACGSRAGNEERESNESPANENDETEEELPENWRDEEVAAIFDGPPTERPVPPDGDPLGTWADDYTRRLRRKRWVAKRRRGARARGHVREHVFAEESRFALNVEAVTSRT